MKAIVKNWKTGIAKGIIVDVSEYPTDGVSNVYKPAEQDLYTHTISLRGEHCFTCTANAFAENFEIVE
jgi:hypothetical protein